MRRGYQQGGCRRRALGRVPLGILRLPKRNTLSVVHDRSALHPFLPPIPETGSGSSERGGVSSLGVVERVPLLP